MTPRLSPREFLRWNDAMIQKYDSEDYHLRSNALIRWIERQRVEILLELLGSGPNDTVVEIGCGAGVVLEQIPARRLLGMDLSRFILDKTRRRLAQRQAILLQGNAEELPFPSRRFDRIVCTEVIEHVQDPRSLVREIARIATPDARIVITIPNDALIDRMKDWVRRLGLSRWILEGAGDGKGEIYDSPEVGNEWHIHCFTESLLREVTSGLLTIREMRAIPSRLFALRYVALCEVDPEARAR